MSSSADTFSGAPEAPPARAWTGRTRGGVFGNWVFVTLIRVAGLWPAYLLLAAVSAYFLVAAPAALRASRDYLARVGCRGPMCWANLRHFYAFGVSLLDRVAALAGQASRFSLEVEGADLLRRAVAEGRGAILVSGHCGNWEMAAHLLGSAVGTPVNMVAFEGEVPHIERLFRRALAERSFSIIPIGAGEATTVAIAAALSRGEIVTFLGDRHLGAHTERVDFLGAPARFPAGPYLVAAITGAPVAHVFAMRTRLFRYRITLYPPERVEASGRAERPARVREAVARYARRLEEQVRRYPFQWSNFYGFWDTDSVPGRAEA